VNYEVNIKDMLEKSPKTKTVSNCKMIAQGN
jgi:hypothetical protein